MISGFRIGVGPGMWTYINGKTDSTGIMATVGRVVNVRGERAPDSD